MEDGKKKKREPGMLETMFGEEGRRVADQLAQARANSKKALESAAESGLLGSRRQAVEQEKKRRGGR